MSNDPTEWDLSAATFDGAPEGMAAMIETLRRYGALSVEFGYRWDPAWGPDTPDSEPPPDVPVTWYAEAEFRTLLGAREKVVREVVKQPGRQGGTHERASVEAMAELVRLHGGHVAIVEHP